MDLGALATRKLQEIRHKYGIQKEPFKLPEFRRADRPQADEETVILESEVKDLFHPSGLLMRNGRIVFAYIRDQRTKTGLNPKNLSRVHMAACMKLKEMRADNQFQRYVVTESMDEEREIDTAGGVVKVRLHPCQYCLGKTGYRGFDYDKMTKAQRETIVNEFRAKDIMPYLKELLEDYLAEIQKRR